jgi:phosphatidylinositol-bisphosphatase
MSYTPSAPEVSPSPTVLTFVNAHLAAFDEMVEKRNFDFHELSRRLVFSPTDRLDSEANTETEFPRKTTGLFESDVLFWMVRFYLPSCLLHLTFHNFREVG